MPSGCSSAGASWALQRLLPSLTPCLHTLGVKTSAPLRDVPRTRFHSSLSLPPGPGSTLRTRRVEGAAAPPEWSWFTPTIHPRSLERDVERKSTRGTYLVADGSHQSRELKPGWWSRVNGEGHMAVLAPLASVHTSCWPSSAQETWQACFLPSASSGRAQLPSSS